MKILTSASTQLQALDLKECRPILSSSLDFPKDLTLLTFLFADCYLEFSFEQQVLFFAVIGLLNLTIYFDCFCDYPVFPLGSSFFLF